MAARAGSRVAATVTAPTTGARRNARTANRASERNRMGTV